MLLAAAVVVRHLEFAIVLQLLLSLATVYFVYQIAQLIFENEPTRRSQRRSMHWSRCRFFM